MERPGQTGKTHIPHLSAAAKRDSETTLAARVGSHAPPCWGQLSSKGCTAYAGRSHAGQRTRGVLRAWIGEWGPPRNPRWKVGCRQIVGCGEAAREADSRNSRQQQPQPSLEIQSCWVVTAVAVVECQSIVHSLGS